MSCCSPIRVSPFGALVSNSVRANSRPSTNMTCVPREPCQPPLDDVLSTVQPSSHRRTHCCKLWAGRPRIP